MDHARPWRAGSLFGCGPRVPLNRDQRGIITQRLRGFRLRREITALHEQVGLELLRLLGPDGRLDPSQAVLAARAGCCERTVSTALRRFRSLGLLEWVRRLVRLGQQVRQTSNAYTFRLSGPRSATNRCDRKPCREAIPFKIPPLSPHLAEDRTAALAALQAVSQRREAAIQKAWQGRRG